MPLAVLIAVLCVVMITLSKDDNLGLEVGNKRSLSVVPNKLAALPVELVITYFPLSIDFAVAKSCPASITTSNKYNL